MAITEDLSPQPDVSPEAQSLEKYKKKHEELTKKWMQELSSLIENKGKKEITSLEDLF